MILWGMETLERLLTISEVAEILRVPKARVYDLVRAVMLPSVRVGRQIRISPTALTAYIESGGKALAGGWRREA